MEDINKDDMNPLKNGERTVLEIRVIDKEKAFSFIGKHILNKVDYNEYGFSIEKMYLSEERYNETLDIDLKQELISEIEHHANEMVKGLVSKLK